MSVHLSFLKRSFINLTIKCSQSRSSLEAYFPLCPCTAKGAGPGEGCGEIRMWGRSRRFCNANSQLAAESGEEVPPLKTPHGLQRPLGGACCRGDAFKVPGDAPRRGLEMGPIENRALKTPAHPGGRGALGRGGGAGRLQPRDRLPPEGRQRAAVLWGLLSRPSRIIRGRSSGTKIKCWELATVIRNTGHSVKLDCFVLSK